MPEPTMKPLTATYNTAAGFGNENQRADTRSRSEAVTVPFEHLEFKPEHRGRKIKKTSADVRPEPIDTGRGWDGSSELKGVECTPHSHRTFGTEKA